MWIEPPFWLLVVATIGWGLNMGITTNLARSIVQGICAQALSGTHLVGVQHRNGG